MSSKSCFDPHGISENFSRLKDFVVKTFGGYIESWGERYSEIGWSFKGCSAIFVGGFFLSDCPTFQIFSPQTSSPKCSYRVFTPQECLCSSSVINGWVQHIRILKVHSCQYYVLHCNAWWTACWQWRKIWSLPGNTWGVERPPWDAGGGRWCSEDFLWRTCLIRSTCT